MTEDLALIESLEESKRVADEISEKVAEAKTTEEQINEARNKVSVQSLCLKCAGLTDVQHPFVRKPENEQQNYIASLTMQEQLAVALLLVQLRITHTCLLLTFCIFCSTGLWLLEEPCSSSC